MVHLQHGANGALRHKGLVGNIDYWGEALGRKIASAGKEMSVN